MLNYLDESPNLPMQLQEMAAMFQAFNTSVAQDLANARSGAAFLEKLAALVNSPTSVSIETVHGVVTVPSLASITAQLSAASFEMQTLTDATTTSVQNALYDAMSSLNTLASTIITQMNALQNDFVTHSQSLVVNAVQASLDSKIQTALPTPASFPIDQLNKGAMTAGQVTFCDGTRMLGKRLQITEDVGFSSLAEGQAPIRSGNNVIGYTPLTYWQRVHQAEIYMEL